MFGCVSRTEAAWRRRSIEGFVVSKLAWEVLDRVECWAWFEGVVFFACGCVVSGRVEEVWVEVGSEVLVFGAGFRARGTRIWSFGFGSRGDVAPAAVGGFLAVRFPVLRDVLVAVDEERGFRTATWVPWDGRRRCFTTFSVSPVFEEDRSFFRVIFRCFDRLRETEDSLEFEFEVSPLDSKRLSWLYRSLRREEEPSP